MSRRKVALELGYKSTLYLVRIEPKPVFEPSIRRRSAPPVPVETAPAESPAAPPRELTTSKRQLSTSSPNILQPARSTVINFMFSADRSFKEKFERLAEVMGAENAQRHMAGDLGASSRHRPREKRPKKEARSAEGEAKGHQSHTSSGGDVGKCRAGRAESERRAGQVAIHSFRDNGAEFIQRKIDKRRKIDERRGGQEVLKNKLPLHRAP